MSFKELGNIKSGYDSGDDDILNDFYIPVLKETVEYRRIAGFFSSTSLSVAARGISGLIKNGGVMEMVVSPRLSAEDVKAMESAVNQPDEIITRVLTSEFNGIENLLQKKRIQALSYLLAKGLLKIKIATVYDNNGRIMDQEKIEESGLFHIKVGVLKDKEGNVLTFSGSVNESASAWLRNIEEFKVFKTWEPGQLESAKIDIDKFDKYWNGTAQRVVITDLPKAMEEKMLKAAPADITKIEDEILKAEKKDKENKIKLNFIPFEYQMDALKVWQKNHRAIFEMATGTGKTKTAQVCVADFLSCNNNPKVIFIICPQDPLCKQWLKDIKDSGLPCDNYVICDSNDNSWKGSSEKSLAYKLLSTSVDVPGRKTTLFVFATFDTYCRDTFINTVVKYKGSNKYFIIGDEVHGLGSDKRNKGFLDIYDYRLGLSATPERWFDEHGTRLITEFFGSDRYIFTIKEALRRKNPITNQTYLTPYKYIPRFVHLEYDELIEYKELTNSIIKGIGRARTDASYAEKINNLMFMRADIYKSAINKLHEFENILDEIGEDISDTILFVSPGQIDEVERIIKARGIVSKRFTKDQRTVPEKQYGNLSEREHIIEMFKEGDCNCLLAIKCLDEGIDIPSAKRAIILASSSNPREYVQRIGRIIRRHEGKEFAELYDIIVEPTYNALGPELAKIEKKIFDKELIRIREISENASNRLDIINIVYGRH